MPRSELSGAAPAYRLTTFRHVGDFGLQGGQWSGDVTPEVDEGLLPFE